MDCMRYRPGIGAVVYRITDQGPRFLIFHRIKNWEGWEMLKGGIADGETEMESLEREIKEETGLKDYQIIKKTGKVIKYEWPKEFVKDQHIYFGAEHTFYLVKANDDKINIDTREHDDYKWVTKEEALKLLTYNNHKRVLEHVIEHGDIK